ncbi:hypothetical protein [Paraburkholderia sp. GAS82]|uniref:hypothetical protein n=1 Tax=Paraburkholderia sp. GAS82 TaxID=3035137 RepID=UPI003D196EEC
MNRSSRQPQYIIAGTANRGTRRAYMGVDDKAVNEIGGREHTILLVDDEPEVLAAWRRILENSGYRVVCASNGIEALA